MLKSLYSQKVEELSVNTKELIERNNEKRTQLTDDNEAYYSDILIYVRLKLELSESRSEEMLMEVLDLLVEGQEEGKTATDIFGMEPVAYAETIIAELPKEKKRNIALFLLGVTGMILGPVLIIRGLLLLILSAFTDVNEAIPVITTSIIGICIILYIILMLIFIVKRTRSSFMNNTSVAKNSLYAGLFAAIGMGILVLIIYTLPAIGPIIEFTWWASIISGVVIWLLVHFTKEKS